MRRGSWGVLLLVLASCATPSEIALERAPLEEPVIVDDAAASDAVTLSTTTTTTSTTTPPTTTTTPPPPPPTTTTAPPAPATGPVDGAWTAEPYRGFGAWLDAYDWSLQFAQADPVGIEGVDHMAAEGVETIYIQASRWNSPTDVLERERLEAIIDRAHQHGIAVVAWYLPTLEDVDFDLRRMLALTELDIDGLGVDIEATDVGDIAERNRRLIDLSARLRDALPGKVLGGIVLEPVLIEDVSSTYWPDFPWAEIEPYYDVWMPMSYWTNRVGAWRHSYDYTFENVRRVRERLGRPDALVHPIGGIGDETTVGDLYGMVTAAVDSAAIGGSIYDYRTSRADFWEVLRAFRTG